MVQPLKYVLCLVLFNTELLHCKYNDCTWHYIRSAWFLDIRISTYFKLNWLYENILYMKID